LRPVSVDLVNSGWNCHAMFL